MPAEPPTHPHHLFPVSPRTLIRASKARLTRHPLLSSLVLGALLTTLYEQPDYFPSADELSTGLVCLLCASLLVYAAILADEYIETRTWDWSADESEDDEPEPGLEYGARGADVQVQGERFGPSTPLLSGDMRGGSAELERHRSGLLGESPVLGEGFRHFSGRGFARRERMRRAVTEWGMAGASVERKREALAVLMEGDGSDGDEEFLALGAGPEGENWVGGD